MLGIGQKTSVGGGIAASRPATSADNNQTLVNNSSTNTVLTIGMGNAINIVTLAQGSSGIVTISAGAGVTFVDIYGNAITELASQGVGTTVTATRTGNNSYTVDAGVISIGQVPFNMQIGSNAGTTRYWEPVKFSNLAKEGDVWTRVSGTGSHVYNRGQLTPSIATDVFRATLISFWTPDYPSTVLGTQFVKGINTPSTLKIRWAGDGQLKIADTGGTAHIGGDYTTTKEFTVTLNTTTDLGIAAFFKGVSLTSLEVIPTVWLDYHDGTNGQIATHWSPDYISFMQSAGIFAYRFMDATRTNDSCEMDWADRPLVSDVMWGQSTPWETIIDLANRTSTDPYICIPARTTNSYHTSLAQLFNSSLHSFRKLMIEYCNETWNNVTFGANNKWVKFKNHTKYSVTPSGTTINWPAHGFSGGEQVVFFRTAADYVARKGASAAPIDSSYTCTVNLLDADNIQAIYSASAVNVTGGLTGLIAVKVAEAATNQDDVNYIALSEAAWNAFSAVMSSGRLQFVLGSQSANTTISSNRLNALSTSALTRNTNEGGNGLFLAIAPYSNGAFWSGAVDLATTVATPKAAGYSGTLNTRVYLASATPTKDEIIAGTGAISTGTIAISYDKTTWTSGVQLTGLTDGTAYTLYFVGSHTLTKAGNYIYYAIASITWTSSTTVQTLYSPISNADAALLDIEDQYATKTEVDAQIALAAAKGMKTICYEGGPHHDASKPAQLGTDLRAYWHSAAFLTASEQYLTLLAYSDIKKFMYFTAPSSTWWGFATSNYDITDNRYGGVAHFQGKARKYFELQSTQLSGTTNVLTDPVTYPYVITTLSDASGKTSLDSGAITYSIVDGNAAGLFDLSGNNLRLLSNGGLNFLAENIKPVLIKADTGKIAKYVNVPVYIGNPGYLNLTTAAYHKAYWFDSGTVVDANPGAPDGVTFIVHKSTAAFGGVHIVRPFENVIAAAGTFTLHFLGRTKPNTPNIRMTIDGSGFFTVGSTTIITGACTYSSPTISISDTSSPFSVTFTNASAATKNVSGVDDFVLRIFFNTSNTSDIEGIIGNLYFTFG